MPNRFLATLGWSNRQCFLFVAFLAAFIFAVLAFGENTLNNALLWLTGVVVLVYTVETHGLRLEMVRQNEINIEPLVIVGIQQEWEQHIAPTERGRMILKNVGRGPALFVRIRDTYLTDVAGDRVRFVAKFDQIDCLESGKDCRVTAKCVPINANVRPEYLDFFPSLDPSTAIENYELTIEHQDTSGQLRQTIVQMGKGGVRLLRHGKVS